jgi:hypothetical protein
VKKGVICRRGESLRGNLRNFPTCDIAFIVGDYSSGKLEAQLSIAARAALVMGIC